MLEGLAAWILNTYVGEYVENLNTDQLSIGLLQGEVELENLPLKKDALNHLGLPVEIRAGFVGKVKLQIPVYRLRSEPWVIFIERLFLIAGPVLSFQYNEEGEQQSALRRKLARLEALEAKWKAAHEIKNESSSSCSYGGWLSYGTSLVANIVENVQLKIKDVHIRYEDEEICTNSCFACGIIIHGLSAQSTDQNWIPKFVTRDVSDMMWKLVELDGLSVYWDTNATILGHLDMQQMTEGMAKHLKGTVSPDGSSKDHDYILAPVHAKAHLQRNCSPKPLRSRSTPRIICDINLEKIQLMLSENQYKQIMEWERKFESLDAKWKYRKWRPKVPVKNNAKKWWLYAASVFVEPLKHQNRMRTWTFVLQRARDIVQYSKVYHKYLSSPESFQPCDEEVKEKLEAELNFEELSILRDIVMDKIQEENILQGKSGTQSKGQGFLQWMFPRWGGWYASQPAPDSEEMKPEETVDKDTMCKELSESTENLKTTLEEEILDVLDSADNDTLLKRDSVFALVNFCLSQGSCTLLASPSALGRNGTKSECEVRKPIIDLEFSDVATKLETRPRSGSLLFEIKLGALYLHDKIFSDTSFPYIIAPQNRDISFMYTKTSSPTVFPFPSFLSQKYGETDSSGPLFELLYEKKPLSVQADHRLVVTTRSLDVVYNPQIISHITDFFYLRYERVSSDSPLGGRRLTEAARARYEVLKQQTKAELRQQWDQILDGDEGLVKSSRWSIELAISAPQIIIPENIFDKNSTVVVFDLGKLQFFNASKEKVPTSTSFTDDIDDDEDFLTPCSTPQELSEQLESPSKLETVEESAPATSPPELLKEHMYERYTLELSDIQILVSRLKDNWKFAQLRGTSTMHILDRFSILVQMERRLLFIQDPLWPAVTLSGNLPKLIVHVSEQKVRALQTCFDTMNSSVFNTYSSAPQKTTCSSDSSKEEFVSFSDDASGDEKMQIDSQGLPYNQKSVGEESLLLLMQFCVDQMSFDVQSRGRSVAELQVTGVKTTFSKRPFDTSVTLCVHSLLLVDALQTYGPDFELLMASHKHVSMDSTSGSLRDSDPSSPVSPGSPDAVHSPHGTSSVPTPPLALSAALSTLQSSNLKVGKPWKTSSRLPISERSDSDALITVEFSIIESPSSSKEGTEVLQISTVQFNNLDVIANQETIVELVGFIKRISLRNRKQPKVIRDPSTELSEIKVDSENEATVKKQVTRTEITFDFHRLNVLLLRAVSRSHSTVGLKVATATMSGARIQATIGSTIEIEGALGGLQVLDLITENTKHSKIISVGFDPLLEHPVDLLTRLQDEMYKPVSHASDIIEPQKALTFSIVRHDVMESSTPVPTVSASRTCISGSNNNKGELDITVRMASLCYTHSPRVLYELSSCATEFKDYMAALASSIKSAATEVAIGIVTKRTESISAFRGGTEVSPTKRRHESIENLMNDAHFFHQVLSENDITVEFKIDVLLQTPVVVVPCSPSSCDVLVAHLGRISVQNKSSGFLTTPTFTLSSCDPLQDGTIFVEVRDMNLYFLNVEKNMSLSSDGDVPSLALNPNASVRKIYFCGEHGQPILHDTILEVLIQPVYKPESDTGDPLDPCFNSELLGDDFSRTPELPRTKQMKVKGSVVTPLKVVLTKHQYQQILKTINYLTYDEPALPDTCLSETLSLMENKAPTNGSFGVRVTHSPDGNSLLPPPITTKSHTSVQAVFELPDFSVELRGDVSEREEGIVSVTFQEFVLKYDNERAHETSFQVTLHALVMEDLRESHETAQCYLMMSSNHGGKNKYHALPVLSHYISSSCPDITEQFPVFYSNSSSSLPDHLHTQNLFSLQSSSRGGILGCKMNSKSISRTKSVESYPSTPPPSPSAKESKKSSCQDALVCINVLLIDKKSPLFCTKYKKTHRFIDIDFNCLDVTLNLQTWVMVLDFFGIGSDVSDVEITSPQKRNRLSKGYSVDNTEKRPERCNVTEVINSEVELTVRSLTVILNKLEYKLASANISNYYSHMSLRDNNFNIQGKLGSISLIDLTPHGHLYPERFVTTGTEALHFNIFRYGKYDPSQQTDYDVSVKCQMSSVRYVHTHRFLSEITAFFQRFTQMQDIMGKIRAAASGAIVDAEATRGSRILLDISAGSPVIIIPQKSSAKEVLVADLGRLMVHNTFLFAGSPGTIQHSSSSSYINKGYINSDTKSETLLSKSVYGSLDKDIRSRILVATEDYILAPIKESKKESPGEDHVCLLDVINVELTDMDLYSAVHLTRSEVTKHKESGREIINDEFDLLFPSFIIKRQGPQLLQQKFMFRVQVERNLDFAISHSVPDMTIEGMFSSVHVSLDLEQYQLIYGILNYNLGEPLEEYDMDPDKGKELFILVDDKEQTWTSMAIHMDLVNVTVELVRNNGIANKPRETPLAKFDFIKSRLSYESYSDGSRDIDLVSNEIRVSDTRYKDAPVNSRPNMFTNILQPTKTGESKASVLQAEIHYRVTSDFTRFTVLLNNMRVMGVFDFLQNVLEFLTSSVKTAEVPNAVKNSADSSLAMQKSSFAVNAKLSKAIQPRFEMKINVTDTELVVVEDTSLWDSSAVILKSTAVITWKPKCPEKPLSCSLQSLEVFSCILGVEDDTALSIIDPVTVNIDIVGKQNSPIAKLHSNDAVHTLEVSLMNLNVRLSYYDITMFLKIIESFKRQTGLHLQKKPSSSVPAVVSYGEDEIKCLEGLGFSISDCRAALDACCGNLNEAALWLTQNASPRTEAMLVDISDNDDLLMDVSSSSNAKEINLQSAEVRVTSCCLCIIDDCKDADVPVMELTLSDLTILQKLIGNTEGHGTFVFSADYYNRALSGWEPVVEPWRCIMKCSIHRAFNTSSRKVVCQVSADDVINLNVTSALLDLYKTVKKNWTEDYLKSTSRNRETNASDVHSPGCYRRRTPFIPFALKNDTGCRLSFATQITSADRLIYKGDSVLPSNTSKMSSDWHEVAPGQVVAVPFESRAKIRHKDSHEMKIHQIVVKVDGWQQVAPVSVDRVGTYFRHAKPKGIHSASMYLDSFPARIVFVVALEGSARKLITVQSALLISNKLEDIVEIKMENVGMKFGAASQLLYVLPDQTIPVPLPFAHAQLWVRPADRAVTFSNHPVAWHHVTKPGEVSGSIRVCSPIQRNNAPYRFSVCVKRMNYPIDKSHRGSTDATSNMSSWQNPLQPGHRLTLLPSLEITNLLPYELHYNVKDLRITGYVRPGKGKPIYDVDISEQFGMEFSMENFKRCNEINISSSSRRYPTRLELYDNQDRLLVLQLRVRAIPGGALKLSVSAPYWLVNRTGLPLVFKQEGTHIEAAGQFEEHELARSMSPLLFSFSDRDASAMCNMRVGKSLHPDGIPQWCTRFHLEKGIRVRRLHVTRRDARPDWVYNIGIDVRMGRGRYRDTNIVTLSPRYQLDNRSSHKLEICQLFATKENRQYILSAVPQCNLPFHWPRIDFDNLLCVRLADVRDCYWSGGFAIDNIMSFHINMRDGQGKSRFIRVEIVLHGATFFIIFTDADRLPPPMRIDNYSEVSVTYYQTNVAEERLKTSVRPHSSVPYAWDEPTLPPLMTCCAPGGSIATYNMNIFREGSQLFYENFIYIAFTGTFLREMMEKRHNFSPGDITCQEYVLDVPHGSKVLINKKEAGKRSQLWRMTSTGMLQHEGSSPPRDPHKSPNAVDTSRGFVLDIASLAPQPGEFIPLMLRKPDERRKLTQTWKFTPDGRLRCGHPNMYVQAKDGFTGLTSGNDVVLGPTLPVSFMTMENGIPIEQAISRQKLRGGSGVLSVQVIPDGPTRVLQICDLKQKKMGSRASSTSEIVSAKRSSPESPKVDESKSKDDTELQVSLKLSGGIGLSLVNHLSEELLYILLQEITVEYCKATSAHTLDGSIKNFQIDNQLREAESPVVLYVSPPNKNDGQRHLPAVSFNIHHVAAPLINAEIFKHFIVIIKNLTILLEERLLLKILQFAGFNRSDAELEKMDENDNQSQRPSAEATVYAQQYYFSTLKLLLKQVRLSVFTTSHLPPDLQVIKKKVGLRLIRFEDAVIELDPFLRIHPFETAQSLIDGIIEHYKEELKGQATNILGAVDFLGNPLGLVNDINDGISSLIHEGNVGGLIKNVAHGLSDSAAKLSETLSDGLGLMTMDDKHQRMRKRIRQESSAAGSDHLMTGLKGLGFGLLGGVTSLFTQTYEGAAQEGIQGFISGLGKGLVGTVAKPAVGFLDFASGAASAVRDTSKKSTDTVIARRRPPRTCVGPVGLLPRYSFQQAVGQEFLYSLNDRNYSELFIAKEQIRSGVEDLQALVSSEQVYFLSSGSPSPNNIVLTVPLGDLIHCSYVCSEASVIGETRHYLQLMMKVDNITGVSVPTDHHSKRHSISSSSDKLCKKPQVRCDSEQIACKVAQQINYAKSLHEEKTYMVATVDDDDRGLD